MTIHTVYVGGHAFDASTPRWLADESRRFFEGALAEPARVVDLFGLDADVAEESCRRVAERVGSSEVGQVVEDLRIDFEDGYGGGDAVEEARDASRCAAAVVEAQNAGELPPGIGLRIRPMASSTAERALGTLDRFVGGLIDGLGRLPDGFVVNLAKIEGPEEIARLADALAAREPAWGLAEGEVAIELMAETPRSLYDVEGRLAVPGFVGASRGRCVGIHFGAYDYTASLGLVASQQRLRHPACDHARGALQVAVAGLDAPIALSDGSPRVVPRLGDPEAVLRSACREAWDDIRHGLERGFVRGWDMAPSHVALRRLAVTAFFLEQLPEASRRWQNATGAASSADLEDAATVVALRAFFRRGQGCGALGQDDVPAGFDD